MLLSAICIYGTTVTATWHFESYGVTVDVIYAADIESTISKSYILWPGEEIALSLQPKSGKLTLDISVRQDVPLIGGLHLSREIDIKPGERREIEYGVSPGVKLKLYGKIDVQATVTSKDAQPKTAACTIPCETRFKIYNSTTLTIVFYATPTVGLDISALGFSKKFLEKQLGSQEMKPPLIYKVTYILPLILTAVAIAINLAAAIYALKALKNRNLHNPHEPLEDIAQDLSPKRQPHTQGSEYY